MVGVTQEKSNDEEAKEYWYNDNWKKPYVGTNLEVQEVRMQGRFISKLSLLEHPILKDLLIHRLGQQTNYLFSPEHADEL